jgi:hypothetical protein
MELLQTTGSDPIDLPTSRGHEPADLANIDLERASWDPEYRRQVLELLRRARCAAEADDPD